MKRFMTMVVAGVLAVAVASTASAGPGHGGGGHGGGGHGGGGYNNHSSSWGNQGHNGNKPGPGNKPGGKPGKPGKPGKSNHPTYGKGHHWTKVVYSERYGRYIYWDPDTECWYYWSEADGCYYPLDN